MVAVRTSLNSHDLPDSLAGLRADIEAAIPVESDSVPVESLPKRGETSWYANFKHRYEQIEAKHPALERKKSAALQIGTLGGGSRPAR